MYSLRSKEKQVIKMKLNNYNNVYSFRPIYKFYILYFITFLIGFYVF